MKRAKQVYDTISNAIEKVLVYFIGISAIVCLVVANIAVLSRYVFKYSLPWSEELLRILFIIIVYIGTALAYRSDALIGITMVEESLIGKLNNIPYKVIKLFQHAIIIIFVLVSLVQANNMMQIQIANNELTPAMEIPAAISTGGVVVGMIIWLFFAVDKVIKYIFIKDVKKSY